MQWPCGGFCLKHDQFSSSGLGDGGAAGGTKGRAGGGAKGPQMGRGFDWKTGTRGG